MLPVRFESLHFSVIAATLLLLLTGCSSIRQPGTEPPPRSVVFHTIGRIPVIEARLNGKPARFIIDTGASVSILNAGEAAFYGFEVFNQEDAGVDVAGFSGISRIQSTGRCIIEIGDLKITHLRFKSRDMHDFAAVLYPSGEARVAGILGGDLLAYYQMRIDFVDRKVFF